MAEPRSVELNADFSSPDATATPWSDVERQLADAEIFWISTVRPDGRPHVTPLIAMWVDDALYVCSGPTERKVMNLAQNAACVLTTGTDALGSGRDVVVEGYAERVTDRSVLDRVAAASTEKYGPPFDFSATDEGFGQGEGGEAHVFRVRPVTVFAFGKGETFSQTRYRFNWTRSSEDSTVATFRTTLIQSGKSATGIEIPAPIIDALGAGRVPPVVVTVNGYTYRSTVAVMGGAYMVGFNADHRAASGISGGDEIEVEVRLDTEPRTVEIPEELAAALAADSAARATFEKLSNSNKGWHVSQVTGAKTDETRERRIAKSIEALREGRPR